MEAFNEFAKTLSWLLDRSEVTHDGEAPTDGNIAKMVSWLLDHSEAMRDGQALTDGKVEWRLVWFESKTFEARLDVKPSYSIIMLADSVWPSLLTFSLGGIEWRSSEAESRHKAFAYSPDEWETWVKIAEGNVTWTAEESPLVHIRNGAVCEKELRFPLAISGPNQRPAYALAAFYGCLWLIAHEAAHAWKNHYKLFDHNVRSSVQEASMLLKGLELTRTVEAEADWAATKFVYFHVLDSITFGYEPGLAYVAGFGIATTILLLAPNRQYFLHTPEMHDPSWMRIHNLNEAAKAGSWHLVASSYPEYAAFIERYGAPHPPFKFGFERPPTEFLDAMTTAIRTFVNGQYDALRFAQAIGDTAREQKTGLFVMGNRHDWRELGARLEDSDVLAMRLRARNELSQLLPEDPRFQGHPLGPISQKQFAFVPALNRPQEA
jgi:hypothetical protein